MIARLKDTLLLVGNESSDRAMLREIFESTYDLLEAEGVAQAKLLLKQNGDCIAAVLADVPLSAPEEIRDLVAACYAGTEKEIPVLLIVTPTGTGQREEYAFSLGATDVVLKPYTKPTIQRRLQVIVDLFLHKWHLEKMVSEQSETIRNTNQVMVDALSAIIEHRSTESGNHVMRIRRFTKVLLEDLADHCPEYNLTKRTIDLIASAAALHDIGKISIPDSILTKPGRLTEEEFEVMKTHTTVGGQLVTQLSGMGDSEYLRYAYNIALYHHERWDGRGYPYGLEGDDIPICAQVVGVADAFDALTTARVYKPAFPCGQAINMILNGGCGVFSPKLLECFKHVKGQFVELANQYSDGYSPKSDQITLPLPGPAWEKSPLNTLQLSQVKYQTLLHYVDDTVLELDLDHGLYHVVYNPNPELESLLPTASFTDMLDKLCVSDIHPDDKAVLDEIRRFVVEEFYDLRRQSFFFRLFSPISGQYQPYELVFLRVNTGNEEQRIVTAIWHRIKGDVVPNDVPLRSSLHNAPALYGLISNALRCQSDKELTIDAGAKDLYSLLGYTEQEIETIFDNKLVRMISSEDMPSFEAAIKLLLKSGGRTEIEFRMLRKDAEPVWVLAKSRFYVEENGQEYIYFAIRDNSQVKAIHNKLLAEVERNQIIIDRSGSIVFEWDLLRDTMVCSDKWEEHFGYIPISENYGAQMGIATHFHPDDLAQLRKCIEQLSGSAVSASLEVRIANSAGKYLWNKITATSCTDENGQPVRIVGLIQDIDELKRASLILKEQAEHDALTKLFNKSSTQQLISDHLGQREENTLDAMIILDLDNFKSVNDTYGHLYGDAFLAQVGASLRRLFRTQDIIGRIGGDEFLVFLKDIPSEEMLQERCKLLLATFRELFAQLTPNIQVSFSIGAALAPEHGSTYSDLFQHADEALYQVKSKGKNAYRLYQAQEQLGSLLNNVSRSMSRIDSDEQPGIANDSFSRFVFRRLYESTDFEATINELLAYIGEQFNVSRVYIFENNEDNTACSNTFEWCNEGISPEKENLQNVSYITDVAGWPEVFNERGVFYCPDIGALKPHFRAILEPQGIKSMLQCAIMDHGVFRGYVGFDECTVNHMWTKEQISLLEFLAEVLAVFLIKKRAQDRALTHAANLQSVLDCQDEWIYVIDPESCEIKFLNDKCQTTFLEGCPDMLCYEAFMGRKSRCENCPAANIRQTKIASAVVENQRLETLVNVRATQILWNNEEACLLTCHA